MGCEDPGLAVHENFAKVGCRLIDADGSEPIRPNLEVVDHHFAFFERQNVALVVLVRPFFDGRWAKVVTHIPGGRALAALLKLLGELATAEGITLRDPWDYILAETAKLPGTDLRIDPAFYFGATGDRGSFTNVREENLTVGHVFLVELELTKK